MVNDSRRNEAADGARLSIITDRFQQKLSCALVLQNER